MTTNNRDRVLWRIRGVSDSGSNESGGSDNVEVGDTEQSVYEHTPLASHGSRNTRKSLPLGVVDTGLLEGLGEDGDGRVDRVGDNQDEGLGAGVGDSLGEGGTDASVDFLHGQAALHSHDRT